MKVYEMPADTAAFFVEAGRRGGKLGGPARAKKLTPERRKEIATKAGRAGVIARWGKQSLDDPRA